MEPPTQRGGLHAGAEAQRALIGWEPVSSRIITAKFATKKSNINLHVIQCYAPTNDAEEEKKDAFYQQLQAVLDRRRNKDITILMGDLNAKIGSDNTGHEEVMGKEGLDPDIENQWQQIKEGYLVTCEDILGRKKQHHKEWISFNTLQKLDKRKQKKAELNTSRTRSEKRKAQEAYTVADKDVKKSIKKDKREHFDSLAKQAEEAAGKGNLRDLYMVTRKLAGKLQQNDKPVKDKQGNPLTTTEEQLKRWAEHFGELLNRPAPEAPPDIPPADAELPINTGKPTKTEIKKAIMSLRNGKSAGPDDITAEALKADVGSSTNILHSL
ncbi:uncharacterized protein LOC144918578 [Branchiostoma floridae x Branchiostoma belcheri]